MTNKKKRKGRIRQTRTDWQKDFDPHPGMIQSFSWSDRIPEFVHISMALTHYDYNTVKTDFYRIADFVNKSITIRPEFHFNLSHTIRLIREDRNILNEIFQTSFKNAFQQLLPFYHNLFKIQIDFEVNPDIRLLFLGYRQILDGRSDTSILLKYLMVQYEMAGRPDPFDMFSMNDKETILQPDNVSRVMAMFPPSIGQSEHLDLHFCQDVWMHNYYYSPKILKSDDGSEDDLHFKEMKIEEYTNEFKSLYEDFKKLNLIAVFHPYIAEINMGFAARISNLTLDAVDLVKNYKGELAELVFRTILENFIVGSWLLKKRDIELHKRFREYTTGRERFFGEKLIEKSTDEKIKKGAKKIIKDAIKEAGVREFDVATERGDIFDLRIDQIAEDVWGKDNLYYFLYKRTSEVVHGQWRVMTKYHLAKSANPMHNGLYFYNDNPKKSAGLIPAFTCLGIGTRFLIAILNEIESDKVNIIKEKLVDLLDRLDKEWMTYFEKYVQPNSQE